MATATKDAVRQLAADLTAADYLLILQKDGQGVSRYPMGMHGCARLEGLCPPQLVLEDPDMTIALSDIAKVETQEFCEDAVGLDDVWPFATRAIWLWVDTAQRHPQLLRVFP